MESEQKKRGAPHKDMTPETQERRKKSGDRVKYARKHFRPKMRQEDLAKKLGIDRKTLSLYENGHNDLRPEYAEILVAIYGAHVDYWLGIADTSDPIEWATITAIATQLKDAAADYTAEQQAKAQYEKSVETIQRLVSAYQTVFHFIGLRYNYSTATATHIVSTLDGSLIGELTWDDFTNLLVELRATVEFFCYKKKKSPEK